MTPHPAIPRVARPRRAAIDVAGMIRAAWEEGVSTGRCRADAPETLWLASDARCDAAFVEERTDA